MSDSSYLGRWSGFISSHGRSLLAYLRDQFTRRRWRFLLLIGGLLLCLAESFLRIAYDESLRIRRYPLVYEADEEVGYRYRPGTKGEICTPSICKEFEINKLGFLGPAVPMAKPERTFRIAVVDSSQATGIWLAEGQPYPRHLENMLKPIVESQASLKLEVINFSVDGRARDFENVEWAKREAVQYSPDLLLMQTTLPMVGGTAKRTVYKDYVLMYPPDLPGSLENAKRQVDYIESHGFLKAMYRGSYLVRAAARMFANRSSSWRGLYLRSFIEKRFQGNTLMRPFSLRYSTEVLIDLDNELRKHGGRLVLIDHFDVELLRTVAAQQGFPYLRVKALPADMAHSQDDHWNDEGHRFVAKQLAEQLAGLLRESPELLARPQ